MGDDPFLQRAWSSIARILGIGGPYGEVTIGDINVMPPSLQRIENPMYRLGQAQQQTNLQNLTRPRAMALDFMPTEPTTAAEHAAMLEAHRRQGTPYRPDPEVGVKMGDIPRDALILGPLRGK